MGKKNLAIFLVFILSLSLIGQNVLLKVAPLGYTDAPVNYPVEIQDAKGNTSVPAGWSSNWTWTAYYAARPTFDSIYTNWQATNLTSASAQSRTNLNGLQLRQTLLLSNVFWFSTNMNALNATLASSNLVLLRVVEERLKSN